MTDKLPEWVDDWLFEHAWPVDLSRADSEKAVSEADLRDFLAQFVLCEREPVATTLPPDPYGDPDDGNDVGVWFSHKDWKQIEELGAGVRLYKAAGGGAPNPPARSQQPQKPQ